MIKITSLEYKIPKEFNEKNKSLKVCDEIIRKHYGTLSKYLEKIIISIELKENKKK